MLASLIAAAFLVIAFIVFTEFAEDEQPLEEIAVTLLEPQAPEESQPILEELEPVLVEEAVRELPALAEIAEPVLRDTPPVESEPVSRDWYAAIDDVVAAVVAEDSRTHSVNPAFDAQRRNAAEQFRPSRAPVERPIWENVERDQLGRRILVHGNCQRVSDDPNVGSNEFFRTFGQYIVSCSNYKYVGKELPWVDEVRDRRVYLQPDPEIRDAPVSDLLADLRPGALVQE